MYSYNFIHHQVSVSSTTKPREQRIFRIIRSVSTATSMTVRADSVGWESEGGRLASWCQMCLVTPYIAVVEALLLLRPAVVREIDV